MTAELAPLVFVSILSTGNGCCCLPVEVELEPPHSVVLGTSLVPVVYEVAQGCAAEAFKRQAFGVEGLLLGSWY